MACLAGMNRVVLGMWFLASVCGAGWVTSWNAESSIWRIPIIPGALVDSRANAERVIQGGARVLDIRSTLTVNRIQEILNFVEEFLSKHKSEEFIIVLFRDNVDHHHHGSLVESLKAKQHILFDPQQDPETKLKNVFGKIVVMEHLPPGVVGTHVAEPVTTGTIGFSQLHEIGNPLEWLKSAESSTHIVVSHLTTSQGVYEAIARQRDLNELGHLGIVLFDHFFENWNNILTHIPCTPSTIFRCFNARTTSLGRVGLLLGTGQEDSVRLHLSQGIRAFHFQVSVSSRTIVRHQRQRGRCSLFRRCKLIKQYDTIHSVKLSDGSDLSVRLSDIAGFLQSHKTEFVFIFLEMEVTYERNPENVSRLNNQLRESKLDFVKNVDGNTLLKNLMGKVVLVTDIKYWDQFGRGVERVKLSDHATFNDKRSEIESVLREAAHGTGHGEFQEWIRILAPETKDEEKGLISDLKLGKIKARVSHNARDLKIVMVSHDHALLDQDSVIGVYHNGIERLKAVSLSIPR